MLHSRCSLKYDTIWFFWIVYRLYLDNLICRIIVFASFSKLSFIDLYLLMLLILEINLFAWTINKLNIANKMSPDKLLWCHFFLYHWKWNSIRKLSSLSVKKYWRFNDNFSKKKYLLLSSNLPIEHLIS